MGIAATFLCTIALAVISIASGNADLSVCGSPPDIQGAVTPQLKTTEHALGTVIAYNCPSGLVSTNVCKQISVCKITKESGRAEWTVPEITCNRVRCEVLKSNDLLQIVYSNNQEIGSWAAFHCSRPGKLSGVTLTRCLENGTWAHPTPTCRRREDGIITPTTDGLQTSGGGETQSRTKVESSSPQTTDVNRNQECFCTHEFPGSVQVQLGNNNLGQRDKIKLGETVSITCKDNHKFLKWQNGFRFLGKANMTCNTCTKWQKEDLPTCSHEVGYTHITYDGDLKILPGGIVHIEKGETRRYICWEYASPPVWEYRNRKNVKVKVYEHLPKSTTVGYYASYLNIEQADNTHNGEYECIKSGGLGGSTPFYLRVLETDTRCPPIDGSGIFTLYYNYQRRINSTVTFYCKNNRMKIEGRSTLTCLSNGRWSGDYPKCVEYNRCPEFPNSSEMRVTYTNGLSVGSWAVFECLRTKKYLSGSHFSICQRNGSWNNPFPLCEDKDSCPEFSNLPEVKVTYSNDLLVGSIATFECLLSNKHLIGKNSSVCQENRSWSNPLPSCEDSKCSIHDLAMSVREGIEPDMSNVTEENVVIGSRIKLKCIETSMMTGDSMAVCEKHGIWKLGNFQCVQQCLLNLNPSSHLLVEPKKDGYRMGEFIFVSCPPGEKISKKVERLMCFAGRWSDSLPECIDLRKKDQH